MAAAEYYMGTAAAQQMQSQPRPPSHELPGDHQTAYQYTQQPPNQLQAYTEKPPTYSPYPSHDQQPRPQDYLPQQYPQHPPPGYQQPYPPPALHLPQQPTAQQIPQGYPHPPNDHLGVPALQQRSHSQPPRVRFANHDEHSTDADSTRDSSSDESLPRRRRRKHRRHHDHNHHHHHHHHRSHSDSGDRGYDSERDAVRAAHTKSRKNRDTFLGAGAGGVIGDAIFPGLGTVGGLLLGGYGGRKRASKKEEDGRSRSRVESGSSGGGGGSSDGEGGRRRRHRHGHGHGHGRRRRHHGDGEGEGHGYGYGYDEEGRDGRSWEAGSGWDEESGTFKKGLAVR